MIILFIVLASGIVIKCVGASCDTVSTVIFSAISMEGILEMVFSLRGIIKIFKVKDK